jgi:methyl-accepting chemotaxis protein
MFKNMSIGTKLIVSFCLASCLTLIVGVTGYIGATRLGAALEQVAGVQLPSIVGLGYVNEAQTAIQRAERTLLLPGLDPKYAEGTRKRLAEAWTNADKGWKLYEPLPQTPEEAKIWKQFVIDWATWKKDNSQVMALIDQGKLEEARLLSFGAARQSFMAAETELGKLADINENGAKEEYARSKALTKTVVMFCMAITVVGFIISIGLGLIISANIKRPLAAGVAIANRIAEGDLSVVVAVDSNDETGQLMAAMKKMVENLRHLVGQTVDISAGIASASNQLHATAEQIATGAEEVASQTGTRGYCQ